MAYQYDVFISYRSVTKKWVTETFLPLFHTHLREAIGGREPDIFIDTKRIENGDAWEQRLKNALAHSKTVVAVLTPSYFHSEWCAREFSVMRQRAQAHGLLSVENPGGLIAPVSISDGEYFPEFVKTLQQEKLHDFYNTAEAFCKTDKFVDFENKVKDWVHKVASIINHAPDWNAEWLEQAWLDDVLFEDLLINQQKPIKLQGL
ncbi:MAG: toll/interleukin-1 receptor domain-containing protein [Chitinophagales bacterium]|nr:toll/interleukin-1 receptor domain-containing protein [Chitinophagales bacterium]